MARGDRDKPHCIHRSPGNSYTGLAPSGANAKIDTHTRRAEDAGVEWAGFQSGYRWLGIDWLCLSGVRRKGERSAGYLDEEGGIIQRLQQGV